MSRYMLDTDTCSYIMKRSNDALLKRLKRTPVSDVCISVITKSQLRYGVEVSPRRQQDEAALNAFLRYVEVLDFPDEAAPHYAKIRADLKTMRDDDRCERPVHCCPCSQSRTNACHEQYERVRTRSEFGHRKLDPHLTDWETL